MRLDMAVWDTTFEKTADWNGALNLGSGSTAKMVSAGAGENYFHAWAILDDNTVKCWGSNYNGQMGQQFKYSQYSDCGVTRIGNHHHDCIRGEGISNLRHR